MTAAGAEYTVRANSVRIKVGNDGHADTNANVQRRGRTCMLQAAIGTQPKCFCSTRQLHLACNPGSARLQQQRHSCPRLREHQFIPVLRSAVVVAASPGDASKAANASAPCVKAAFAKAGLSQDAIDHILTRYPAYLRWDVEQKLLPAMQQKQQELGASFPSEFRRVPLMLLTSIEVLAKARTARKATKVKAASGNASNVKAAFAAAVPRCHWSYTDTVPNLPEVGCGA